MCLIGIELRRPLSGHATLRVAANRDELYARPAQPAHWWEDLTDVCAGRDLAASGTWLGVSRTGRFAAVTNVRTPTSGVPTRSRGELPVNFLASSASSEDFCQGLIPRAASYGPFNLLVFDGRELWWCNNQARQPQRIPEGIHGLSNAALNTPWPKVQALSLVMGQSADTQTLISTLARREIPPGRLPDTGVGEQLEQHLAPMFIRTPNYGTRCTSVVALGPAGGQLVEVTYNKAGAETGRVTLALSAPESARRR